MVQARGLSLVNPAGIMCMAALPQEGFQPMQHAQLPSLPELCLFLRPWEQIRYSTDEFSGGFSCCPDNASSDLRGVFAVDYRRAPPTER